jgi:hypothetical protein
MCPQGQPFLYLIMEFDEFFFGAQSFGFVQVMEMGLPFRCLFRSKKMNSVLMPFLKNRVFDLNLHLLCKLLLDSCLKCFSNGICQDTTTCRSLKKMNSVSDAVLVEQSIRFESASFV